MKDTISDELLAAYLDGNTSSIENLLIEAEIDNNPKMLEATDIMSDMTLLSQFGAVPDSSFNDFFSQQISIDINTFNEDMDNNGIIPDIQQQYPDSCAIKSQQIILNEFGIDVNEDQLVQFSYEHGWYNADGTGTAAEDVGNLLESANIPVTRQHIYLLFQEVCKQEAALDMSGAAAGGAGFLHLYLAGGTHTLASNLHQTKFRERQNIVACAVFLHVFDHALIEFLAIFGQIHVDKVHHNDSAHIAKTQLTRQFVSGIQVHVEGIDFLALGSLGTVAAVDINDMQGLGMLNIHVGSLLVGDGAAETGLDVLRHREIVKDGHVAFVEFDDTLAFGSDEPYIIFHLVIDSLVVDVDVFVGRIEEVAQKGNRSARFLIAEEGHVGAFLLLSFGCRLCVLGVLAILHDASDSVFPSFNENL